MLDDVCQHNIKRFDSKEEKKSIYFGWRDGHVRATRFLTKIHSSWRKSVFPLCVYVRFYSVGTCMTQSRMFHTDFCKENQRIGLVQCVYVDVFPHWVHTENNTHTKKKRNAEKVVHVHMGQDKWILELSHYNNTHHHRRFV